MNIEKYQVKSYDIEALRTQLGSRKSKQKFYHDNHNGTLKQQVRLGSSCHFRTARGHWIPAVVTNLESDMSYVVTILYGLKYRRNRIDIKSSSVETTPIDVPVTDYQAIPVFPSTDPVIGKNNNDNSDTSESSGDLSGRENYETRSGRTIKPPSWRKDYVMAN